MKAIAKQLSMRAVRVPELIAGMRPHRKHSEKKGPQELKIERRRQRKLAHTGS